MEEIQASLAETQLVSLPEAVPTPGDTPRADLEVLSGLHCVCFTLGPFLGEQTSFLEKDSLLGFPADITIWEVPRAHSEVSIQFLLRHFRPL